MDQFSQPKRFRRSLAVATISLSIFVGIALYAAATPNDPPGFYVDESSIAYNAYTIAQTGRDEYGVSWPLYFRAFGEFKNPIYIYALAAIFKITGPSIRIARLFSAMLGAAACLLLGWLAWCLSGRVSISIIVFLSALLTPWLYEGSRLVFEVAAYPLATVLFLLALQTAALRKSWNYVNIVTLAACLAALTYTYSIGRLLGPLFALGLLIFARKDNRRAVALTLAGYALTLLPLAFFAFGHPAALTSRLNGIGYLNLHASLVTNALQFAKHYAADINPVAMLMTGENNPRDHIPGMGALEIGTFVLAFAGLVIVIRRRLNDPWWRFIVYAFIVSIVPAALTANYFPQLRLIATPVLLHVLMVPALQRITGDALVARTSSRKFLIATICLVLIIVQGAYFQFLFHRYSPSRWYFMDARFNRKILDPALELNRRPIYLYDPPGRSGYIQALWYGALRGIKPAGLRRLSPGDSIPADRVVISTETACTNCRVIARNFIYLVYVTLPSALRVNMHALPPEGFRAAVALRQTPTELPAAREVTLRASITNISTATWPCVGDDVGRYAIDIRARWRAADGTIISDGGRTIFDYDLEPGDVGDSDLRVMTPRVPGQYILEVDVVEEPDRWFAANGSKPLLLPITVFQAS